MFSGAQRVGIKKVGWAEYSSTFQADVPWVPVVQVSLQDLGIPSGQENQGVREDLSLPIKTKTRGETHRTETLQQHPQP